MAEVFLAKTAGAEGIEKTLVVKRVLPSYARNAKFLTMFVDEAKVAMRLNHPNVVQVYSFEQARDEFLLAMEFVDGLDLGRLVSKARRQNRGIAFGLSAYLTMEIAKGLDYAHNRKDDHGEPLDIVHRDVSPQNVLLSYEGSVKVADFGIARARLGSADSGIIRGKFSYMSPEQARGEHVDRRSDIYSLGIVFAELLMNRSMYFGQKGVDVLEWVRQGRVTYPREINREVPDELEQIVRKALAFDARNRFATCREMAVALGQFLHRQEDVYDGDYLERAIVEIAPKEPTAEKRESVRVPEELHEPTAGHATRADRERREKHNVAVISGSWRVSEGAARIANEATRTLEEIAYKADAVLSWTDASRHSFRLVLGLRRPSVLDPLRSLRLALDIVDVVHALSEDSPVLDVGMGVSRGTVVATRDRTGRLLKYEPVGAVFGAADALALRANSSQILATGEIYRLARRHFAFDEAEDIVVPLGETGTLKGHKLQPGMHSPTEPGMKSEADGFIGRHTELRAIQELYTETLVSQRSAFVALVGELGVGKTALAHAAVARLDPPPNVLHSECVFGTSDQLYEAVAQLARQALAIQPNATEAEVEHAVMNLVDPDRKDIAAAAMKRLLTVNQARTRTPQVELKEDVTATLGIALRGILGSLARRNPLVMLIDGAQWADAPSIDLMRVLVERVYDVPLLCIVASRPDERIEQALRAVPVLDIGELSPNEARQLLRSRLDGANVAPELEQAVLERTGGNPLFINELVDALIERGAVRVETNSDGQRTAVKTGPLLLPTTVEDVYLARIAELSPDTKRALRWLAVLGSGTRQSDLEHFAGTISESLKELEARNLVRTSNDTLMFANAVLRQVAYQSIDDTERAQMHRRVAQHLLHTQTENVSAARLANHLEQAGEAVSAVEWYARAAQTAYREHSNRDALGLCVRILALTPSEAPQRFFAHELREQIFRVLGRREEQRIELEAMKRFALKFGNVTQKATAFSRLAGCALDDGRTEGVDVLLNEGLAWARQAQNTPLEVELLRLSALFARERGKSQDALQACEDALNRAGVDEAMLAARGSVLVQKGILLRRLGHLHDALKTDVEAFVIFRRLGLRRLESQALNALTVVLSSIGEYEDALVLVRAAIATDLELGDRFHVGMKLSNLAQLYLELGDYEQARRLLGRAMAILDASGDDSISCDALCALAELQLEADNAPSECLKSLDAARSICVARGDTYDLVRERTVRAWLDLAMGHYASAAMAAEEAARTAGQAGLVGFELLARAREAEAEACLGHVPEARRLALEVYGRVLAHESVERSERVLMSVGRALSSIGEEDLAAQSFTRAWESVSRRLTQLRNPDIRQAYQASRFVGSLANVVRAFPIADSP